MATVLHICLIVFFCELRVIWMPDRLHRAGFTEVTKMDDALRLFFGTFRTLSIKPERVDVKEALGRVLAEDIVAKQWIPPTDRSAMDGYAVRSQDTRNASDENPAVLQVVGESRLGEASRASVKAGEAVAVATGSMIPCGADTVVTVERTNSIRGGRIEV